MGNGMRALKVVTIVMGVMIVAGTGVLIAVIAHRVASPAPNVTVAAGTAASGGAPAGGPPFALALDEPAGTHIAGIVNVQSRGNVGCHHAKCLCRRAGIDRLPVSVQH